MDSYKKSGVDMCYDVKPRGVRDQKWELLFYLGQGYVYMGRRVSQRNSTHEPGRERSEGTVLFIIYIDLK